jgi:hypothetical protein
MDIGNEGTTICDLHFCKNCTKSKSHAAT